MLEEYYHLNQNESDVNPLAGNLLFPWSSSQNPWTVGPQGFHSTGYVSWGVESGSEAIDLIPPSSASPARVIAMENGTVVFKYECTWNTLLIFRYDGYPDPKRFVYMHIQNGTSPVGIGVTVTRGQYMGNLRSPVFNGTCSGYSCEIDNNPATGNLCSYSTARHLHLGFGTNRNIIIDGNVVANLVIGRSYNSTNVEGGGSCYTLTQAWTGSGNEPTASPTNSSGCSNRQYHSGESINLTAHPASGWHLDYWGGTDSSSSGHLTMPSSNHTVTANYLQDVSCIPNSDQVALFTDANYGLTYVLVAPVNISRLSGNKDILVPIARCPGDHDRVSRSRSRIWDQVR